MRIALICPYSLDRPGGVQQQALGMARALSLGHEVTLFAPSSQRDVVSRFHVVALGRFIGIPANGSIAPIGLTPSSVVRLLKGLRAFAPDLCIIHEPLVPLVSVTALFAAGCARIGVFHRGGDMGPLRFLGRFARRALSRLDAGVVVSEEARRCIQMLAGAAVLSYVNIPNGVEVARISGLVQPERHRKTVLFVGRHEKRKGLRVLLHAFAGLPADYELWVVGKGPETPDLMAEYVGCPSIHWLGIVKEGELSSLRLRAGLFVAPSLSGESFGVVLLEAMAAGLPVVCSDLPGYRRAAEDAAIYVSPGNVDELRRAILSLSDDEERHSQLVMLGKERAASHDFSLLAARYVELANELVGNSSRGTSAQRA